METYLRHNEAQQLIEERDHLRSMLTDPMKGVRIEDRPAMERRERAIAKRIDETVAPDLTPEKRDKIAKLEAELREKIQNGMPSSEEMRKSPPGALGKHMKWERANKNDILVWKNCRLALNKGDDDPDLANVELLRPRTSSLNMDNAIVPGTHYDIPSQQFMENFDKINWSKNNEPSEEIESLRNEISVLKQMISAQQGNGGTEAKKEFTGSCDACKREFTAGSQARIDFSLRQHKKFCKAGDAAS